MGYNLYVHEKLKNAVALQNKFDINGYEIKVVSKLDNADFALLTKQTGLYKPLNKAGIASLVICKDSDEALELIRDGARDYILYQEIDELNDRLEGLIKKAINEKESLRILRQLNRENREKINNMPLAYFDITANGKIIDLNPALCQLTGYDSDKLLSMSIDDLLVDQKKGIIFSKLMKREGFVKDYLIQLKRSNEIIKTILINATPLYEDEQIERYQGFATDITKIKDAEKYLKLNEERYRELFNNMTSGCIVFVKNNGYPIADLNWATEQIEGVKRRSVIGKGLNDAFPELCEAGLKYRLDEIDECKEFTLNSVKNGEILFWKSCYAYKLPSGEIVMLYDDITKEKQMIKRKKHAESLELVGRLASGIIHDFRNILTHIIGYTDLAIKSENMSEIKEYLEKVQEAGNNGKDLVNRVPSFKKVDNFEKININECLEDVVKLVEPTFEKIKINIQYENNCYVIGNKSYIYNSILNLMVNAKDAMPDGGEIYINLSKEKYKLSGYMRDCIKLEIKDTGLGIEPLNLEKIFNPFFSTKKNGTGLGLKSVYDTIHNHNGDIKVENDNGAKFTIYLPED